MTDRGQLTIVGSGIASISQFTLEARAAISGAHVVFYHATNGVSAAYIRGLNPHCIDVYQYYGEGKRRRITYLQIAELMLREVRAGRRVAGVFHGHPGFFVMAARRALAIAADEGHATGMLPGVSSVDCLIADLGIDPGVQGMQILKAGSFLRGKARLADWSHVVLLQVSSVGDSEFSFTGYKNSRRGAFLDRLIAAYGPEHRAVYYQAATIPGFAPVIVEQALAAFAADADAKFGPGILYLPPRGQSLADVRRVQNFGGEAPYDAFARQAVEALDHHVPAATYTPRTAPASLVALVERLAGDAAFRAAFEALSPAELETYPELIAEEHDALLGQQPAYRRARR